MSHWGRQQIIEIALLVSLLVFALWCPVKAGEIDIWYRYPDATVWQQCISYDNSTGVGPVEHYIPPGAIIAIRDRETWSLIIVGRGE
jgi:hypothetical protein